MKVEDLEKHLTVNQMEKLKTYVQERNTKKTKEIIIELVQEHKIHKKYFNLLVKDLMERKIKDIPKIENKKGCGCGE